MAPRGADRDAVDVVVESSDVEEKLTRLDVDETHDAVLAEDAQNLVGARVNWTERDGTEWDGMGRDGTERNGTERDGTGRNGTERDGTGRNRMEPD